jgi:hypothetical protein
VGRCGITRRGPGEEEERLRRCRGFFTMTRETMEEVWSDGAEGMLMVEFQFVCAGTKITISTRGRSSFC